MKRVSTSALILTLSLAAAAGGARGQAGVRPRTAQGAEREPNGNPTGASEARTLYEEASQYAQRKFDEFRQKQMPYDPLLEQRTLQEQKDLALQYAARLTSRPAARAPLRGTDLFYAGLLYSLAGKGEGALDSMRKFLAEADDPALADLRQRARSVAAQQAAQLGLLEEAERSLADYSKAEPRNVADLHRMNLLVASAYVKKKEYARAAAPAAGAYAAALEYARTAKDPVQRDSTIFGAGSFYANVLFKADRRAEGLRVAQEMRGRALAIPSARLYGQATDLVLRQGEPFSLPPAVAGLEPAAAPEITVAEVLGQGPIKLSGLRGKVVLLDFWATWCTFCVKTMPRLNAMHEKYKDRGLRIIGLNEFEGQIKGEPATRAQELEYFRQFKRRMNVAYDFGVAADARNDGPYGVASLPTAVLVDRRGRVRFLSVSASEQEAELLKTMIVKLLDEPAP